MDEEKYREALRTPSEVFATPATVAQDEDLSAEQKLEILNHWEAEAIQLQESEAEGFGGGERSLLGEIKRAIESLGEAGSKAR